MSSLQHFLATGIAPYHTDQYEPFHVDYEYLRWVPLMLEKTLRSDRTKTGTHELFGIPQITVDLRKGFPLLTTKKLHLKSIIYELLWFLKGDTNVHYLQENGVRIWDEWANEAGDLGPVYGKQWVRWEATDGTQVNQIKNVLDEMKRWPNSRGLIVSAWNPPDLPKMALRPCHAFFQLCIDENEGCIDMKMYQRSADWFLGVPFNIASYALLLKMFAHVTGYTPRYYTCTYGSAHIYSNHVDQMRLQLTRDPRKLPVMSINPDVKDMFNFRFEDFLIEGYDAHPHIKGKVAV